jgi:predicted site-specific integrase-resolvase
MTSCIHKMCERTYGKKNMKRAITLAKINHP